MGQRGTHLGDGEGEPEIHHADDDRGDEHSTPTALQQATVPSGEMSGDDRAHAERPEMPDVGVTCEQSLAEVGGVAGGVPYAASRAFHWLLLDHDNILRNARRIAGLRRGRRALPPHRGWVSGDVRATAVAARPGFTP